MFKTYLDYYFFYQLKYVILSKCYTSVYMSTVNYDDMHLPLTSGATYISIPTIVI